MSLVCNVVGARPNFMKICPIIRELETRGISQALVHTGQHYDGLMSGVFFEDLRLAPADVYLGVGSGSHADQTARIMTAFEKVCLERRPELVVVAGDVNSTLACALVAAKLQVPVAHVEAGLRSFDRTMPEEINRIVTDHLSDLLFVSEPSARTNLLREGISAESIFFVGNCMIDSLLAHIERALSERSWEQFGLKPGGYGLVTLHRPVNVDDEEKLREIYGALDEVSKALPLIFPLHPRTRDRVNKMGLKGARIEVVEPLGYVEFLGLMAKARLVLTDSGGVQEETTLLGIPCVTLRDNTERPITIHGGTNRLAGRTRNGIVRTAFQTLSSNEINKKRPELWDGRAAHRIVDVIEHWLSRKSLTFVERRERECRAQNLQMLA
jgi:UDP-N-acetylglucosamine 2-epimerase (non-hydrolysing)